MAWSREASLKGAAASAAARRARAKGKYPKGGGRVLEVDKVRGRGTSYLVKYRGITIRAFSKNRSKVPVYHHALGKPSAERRFKLNTVKSALRALRFAKHGK